jgi:hypothetical protein
MISKKITQTKKAQPPHLWWSFIVIIAGFIISNGVLMYEMQNAQQQVRRMTRHRLSNIELVSRLLRDLNQERLLVDAHIF